MAAMSMLHGSITGKANPFEFSAGGVIDNAVHV
jgi:hypothetical protein